MEHIWTTSEQELLAGKWKRPDDSNFCRWYWHAKHRLLIVIVGTKSKQKRFGDELELLEHKKLQEVLPEFARRAAENMIRSTESVSEATASQLSKQLD